METQTQKNSSMTCSITGAHNVSPVKNSKLVKCGIILTHYHILAYPIHIRLIPGGQGVDRHKVGLKLAIWVGEDSLQPGDKLCGAAFVWTQEKPLLVVIIGMNVIPDHRGSS